LVGPSGSGKSSLALELMSRGAALVSDDLAHLFLRSGQVMVSAPPDVPPVAAIEARGLGLLRTELAGPAPLHGVVDLSVAETARLPELRALEIEGREVPCLRRVDSPAFPAMLLQFLRGGWYPA
jgi:HPr kinase/phosphorylase